uniref:Intraflagellar transport protein 57 homolog n=1 Tax=Strigamia maritima TaxID=126957 RepID=T1J408_STRMM
MANDEKKRGDEVIAEDGGPGMIFMPFVVMDEVLDKLNLLDYEKEFVRDLRMKSLNRHYFALQTNPGEQFHLFTSLCAWLIRKQGKSFEPPQEYDDPNSTISNILDVVRELGDSIDFPPSKLKQGYGDRAIYVLNRLADEALIKRSFHWKKSAIWHYFNDVIKIFHKTRPNYPQETAEDEFVVDDEAELSLAKVEEEILNEADSEDEEEQILGLDDLKTRSLLHLNPEQKKVEEILESTTDTTEWRLEVERVLPQLKVTIRNDNKDWHNHVEQMHNYKSGINDNLTTIQTHLSKLHGDIEYTLEKIKSREKYLNTQLESLMTEFRCANDQFAQTKEQYRQVSGGVVDRSRQLAQVSDELEIVKQEMEERGSNMTDGTPLVNVRKALGRIKNEIMAMNVRIGVAEQTLLHASLKTRNNLQDNMNADHGIANFD